jgi:hypothetical protein
VFNSEGDCLAAKLRPGNVHSADEWDEVLHPIVDRYRAQGQTVVVRADAAFALPALYEALEPRGVRYAVRLPANDVLERRIEDLLTRPRGRPSHAPLVRYRSFEYQAASWSRPRRVIAKVEHHLGELFPRVGFIVTTLTGTNRAVVRFYNQRGTAERLIRHTRYFVLQLAESYLTSTLFRQIPERIERLAWHPTWSRAPRSEGDDE